MLGTFWQSWLGGDFDQTEEIRQLGGDEDGMLSEYVRLDQHGLVHAPEHLSDEEAATLPCAALTVWQALVTEGRLKAGETVLVQGTGGVSIFALQFAAMFGAMTIVTSSSDAKLERAKNLGATHTINYVEDPVWHPEVRRLNGGRGIDHVVEVGGPDSFLQSLAGDPHGRPNPHDRICRQHDRRDQSRSRFSTAAPWCAAFRSARENRSSI